jgi:hypothetical protein
MWYFALAGLFVIFFIIAVVIGVFLQHDSISHDFDDDAN